MKKLIIGILLLSSISQAAPKSKVKTEINEQMVEKCLSEYSFLRDLLVNLSDQDFNDSSKRDLRTAAISEEYKRNSFQVTNCLEKVLLFAKVHEDSDIFLYVVNRLSEVSQVVYYQQPKGRSTAASQDFKQRRARN